MSFVRSVIRSRKRTHEVSSIETSSPPTFTPGGSGCREDFVKVLDFGLVKTAAVGDAQSLATIEGVIMGTPAYMAPEMALDDNVDGRTDLYALGCVAYYLLTGEQVFTGDT